MRRSSIFAVVGSTARLAALAALLLPVAAATGCASAPAAGAAAPPPATEPVVTEPVVSAESAERAVADGRVVILAINDVYRIQGIEDGARGGLARLRTLRAELERDHPDLLLLHAGDLLYPSFPSRTFDGAQMIDVLNLLDGDAAGFDERMFATFGNHEFDEGDLEDAPTLDLRVEESAFWWLDTNVEFAAGDDGRPLVAAHNLLPHALVEAGGSTVGLFSLTLEETRPEYVAGFTDRVETARRLTAELRAAGADLVIGLTHLNAEDDVRLLNEMGADGPDLVVGGHDHQRQARNVAGRWVLKADADAVTATVIEVTPAARPGQPPTVDYRWVDLGGDSPAPDPAVASVVEAWGKRHDHLYCSGLTPPEPDGCLDEVLGRTAVDLAAEELEIRRFETNFGNWITDRMLEAFDEPAERPAGIDADTPLVAFINSGSLRLNQDIPVGPVRREHVEELFAYPSPLVLLRLDGRTLRQVLSRSVDGWTGNGWWLQVAGLAFRQDPQAEAVEDVTLLTADGPRPLRDDEEVLAVTQRFLVDPSIGNRDGYTMLELEQVVALGPDLEQRVLQALEAAGSAGIAPQVEGRICNPTRPDGPCLAVPSGSAP